MKGDRSREKLRRKDRGAMRAKSRNQVFDDAPESRLAASSSNFWSVQTS